MATGRTDPNRSERLPRRQDGVDEWATQHRRAAQLRARGLDWVRIADELGYSHSTVRQYGCIPGFTALVHHYQRQTFEAEIRALFHSGSIEALHAIREQFLAGAQEVAELERQLADREVDGRQAAAIEQSLFSRSKATTYSADKFLDAIGFKRFRQRLAEMQAETREQGAPGQTVRHEGGSRPVEHTHDHAHTFDDDTALEIARILHDVGALNIADGEAEAADDAED